MVVVAPRKTSKPATQFTKMSIDLIDTHPLNTSLYGENEDLSQLKKAIEITGRIKPILVTLKEGRYTAICGNSCLRVARELGYVEVQAEIVNFASEIEETRALLAGNVGREKTIEQKVREGWLWEKIEKEEASVRMLAGKKDPKQNSAEGQTRDIVAKKVGLGSGFNYEHASLAVQVLDKTKNAPTDSDEYQKHQKLKQILSGTRGVDRAYKLTKSTKLPSKPQPKWIPKPFERVNIIGGLHKGKKATVTIVLGLEVMAHIDGAPEGKRDNIAFRCLEQIEKESSQPPTSVKQELKQQQQDLGFGTRKQIFPDKERNEGHPQEEELPASVTNINTVGDALITEMVIGLLKLTDKQLFEVMSKAQPDLTASQLEAIWKGLKKSLAHKAA